jgi:hypothetical protein
VGVSWNRGSVFNVCPPCQGACIPSGTSSPPAAPPGCRSFPQPGSPAPSVATPPGPPAPVYKRLSGSTTRPRNWLSATNAFPGCRRGLVFFPGLIS